MESSLATDCDLTCGYIRKEINKRCTLLVRRSFSHTACVFLVPRQTPDISRINLQTLFRLVLSCSCLCRIHWSQVFSLEWRCGWSSADRRCSNYIWVINNFIAYLGDLISEVWGYVPNNNQHIIAVVSPYAIPRYIGSRYIKLRQCQQWIFCGVDNQRQRGWNIKGNLYLWKSQWGGRYLLQLPVMYSWMLIYSVTANKNECTSCFNIQLLLEATFLIWNEWCHLYYKAPAPIKSANIHPKGFVPHRPLSTYVECN